MKHKSVDGSTTSTFFTTVDLQSLQTGRLTCFNFNLLQSLEHKKYDVPLLAISYSYSRWAVVWRIEPNIILHYIKITYYTKYEVRIG